MLSAAKHLCAERDRCFAALSMTQGDCSPCQGLFFTIEPCLKTKTIIADNGDCDFLFIFAYMARICKKSHHSRSVFQVFTESYGIISVFNWCHAWRASSTEPSSSMVETSPGSRSSVTARSTRRIILPLRVLGSILTKLISLMTTTGPNSLRTVASSSFCNASEG